MGRVVTIGSGGPSNSNAQFPPFHPMMEYVAKVVKIEDKPSKYLDEKTGKPQEQFLFTFEIEDATQPQFNGKKAWLFAPAYITTDARNRLMKLGVACIGFHPVEGASYDVDTLLGKYCKLVFELKQVGVSEKYPSGFREDVIDTRPIQNLYPMQQPQGYPMQQPQGYPPQQQPQGYPMQQPQGYPPQQQPQVAPPTTPPPPPNMAPPSPTMAPPPPPPTTPPAPPMMTPHAPQTPQVPPSPYGQQLPMNPLSPAQGAPVAPQPPQQGQMPPGMPPPSDTPF